MARIYAFLFVFSAVAACANETKTAGLNLGENGANCLRTPDCEAPLQCIQNVCSSVDQPDTRTSDTVADASGGTETTTAATTTATHADASDTQANETLVATEPDTSADTAAETAIATSEDTTLGEIGIAETNLGGDCGELGVASNWQGTFEGAIDYNVTPNPLTPSTGTLQVNGSLSFEITCVESKFIVRGNLDGNAVVPGQLGIFPFQLTLQGHYNKDTKTMTAKMVDGTVSIYGLVHVYFEGDFPGAIGTDGDFHGTWSGKSTGTDSTLITGDATGSGTWDCSPQP